MWNHPVDGPHALGPGARCRFIFLFLSANSVPAVLVADGHSKSFFFFTL